MSQLITVEARQVYGKTVYYPACERAHAFAKISGLKTLSEATLLEIQALGFEINLKAPALPASIGRGTKVAAIRPAPPIDVLEEVAKRAGFPTLQTRNSDSLDFREVSVWTMREVVMEAFQAGARSAR